MNNNKTILTMAFLLAGTLLTATMSIAPALAERDHDDEDNDWEDGRDGDGKDGKYGDGNKQKVEDDSAGALNDCDTIKNEFDDTVENVNECIAIAATDESVVRDGGGDGNGDGNGDGDQGDCPEGLVEINAEPLLCLVVAPDTTCEDVGLVEISAEPLICGEILTA